MARPPIRSQMVSAPVLAVLVEAARKYLEDLESGLADGTYDDCADRDAVREALEIVDPEPRTAAERLEAKAAGYLIGKHEHDWLVWPPHSSLTIGRAGSASQAWDIAARHLIAQRKEA